MTSPILALRDGFRTLFDLAPGTILRFRRSADRFAPQAVGRRTDFVVDGFPRSANTYCYYYLQLCFPEASIAHHVHSWQQFFLAWCLGKPSVLIVREPDACVASLLWKQPGRSAALTYLDYALLNVLAVPWTRHLLAFEQAVDESSLKRLAATLSQVIQQPALAVAREDVEALMSQRTAHKNSATKGAVPTSGVFVRWARRLAVRAHARALRQQRGEVLQ